MTEKKADPRDPRDPRHTAQHTAVGADPSSGEARRAEADAIQARSTEAFNAANQGSTDSARDLRGTPVDAALRTVKEALQNLPDDQSRRLALREAAQACGIDITTLSADPTAPTGAR